MQRTHGRWIAIALTVVGFAAGILVIPDATAAPEDTRPVPDRSRVYTVVDETAACGTATGVRIPDGDLGDWSAPSGGVTGTGHYAGGEYLWVDYTYDDAGTGRLQYPGEADVLVRADGEPVGHISPLLDRYGGSAADIVEARLASDDDLVHLAVGLNFLNATDTTTVTFGFDIDGDDGTGVHDWPFGARVRTEGADVFVTAHPTDDGFCATVTDAEGKRSVDDLGGAAAIDTSTNAIEVSMPRSLLGPASTVEVVGGSGLWDVPTGQWKQPISGQHSPAVPEAIRGGEPTDVRGGETAEDPGVFNLLFRGDEPMIDLGNAADAGQTSSKRAFEYNNQAATLLGGTTGGYALVLDLARIAPGAPAEPQPTQRGDMVEFTRQYVSDVDLEGLLWVENDLGSDVLYLGRHQSYAVRIPPCLEAAPATTCPATGAPMSVNFHGGSGSHVNQIEQEGGFTAAELATRAEMLTVAPFGRGRRAPWWRGLGEVDVLEAMADAEAAYRVDPDRRVADGHSLGGYATYRFATLYPDLWAGAAPMCAAAYENTTSTREAGVEVPETQPFTVEPLLGSLVNTPVVQVVGTQDPLIRIAQGHRLRDRMLDEGVPLRYTEWPNGSHCFFVPQRAQLFLDRHLTEVIEMAETGRALHPAVVRYAVDPRQFHPGVEWMGVADIRDLGVEHDGAWWIDDATVRDELSQTVFDEATEIAGNVLEGPDDEVVGTVTAVSHMLDGWQRTPTSCGDEIGLAGQSGNDKVSPIPGGTTGVAYPDPHHFICQEVDATASTFEPILDLTVSNLAHIAVDTVAAGFDRSMTIRAIGDGTTTVRLTGLPAAPAHGDCVRGQTVVDGARILTLELSGVPCEVRTGVPNPAPPTRAGPERAPDHTVDGRIDDWVGESVFVAGTNTVRAGEFIHTDYIYDDTGADVFGQRPTQRGTFEGQTTGTFRYPADPDRYADNAADLLELRLATDGDMVHGLVRLNTLRATDTTVAAIAVDLDGDLTDTVGTWPRDATIATPGADVVMTVWGTGGEITDLTTGASTPMTVAADPDDDHNAIEFAVPRALLHGDSWTLWAGTGLWDGEGWIAIPGGSPTETAPGHGDPDGPRLFNVAFRGIETGGYYEDRQAAALLAGDISAFSTTVDVAVLDANITETFEYPVGEYLEVIVDQPDLTIGPLHEGTSHDGGVPGRNGGIGGLLSQSYEFFGRHQPYTLRLPDDWADDGGARPVLFALHGLGGALGGWVQAESFRDQVLEPDGHDPLVLVAPLARGSSFYADFGELDALATLADAEARLHIDPDRRYLLGYSMGGYGVYRFATTRPDMWASAATYAGYTGEFTGSFTPEYTEVVGADPMGLDATFQETTGLGGGRAGKAATGNPVDLVGNLREIPLLHNAPSNDEIVPTSGQYRASQELDALDYRHRFDLYPGYEHLSFAVFDNWAGVRDWFGDTVRTRTPRRITYAFSPNWADPDIDLGIRHDRAYWVSDLVRRLGNEDPVLDTLTYATIDAESHAVPGQAHASEAIRTVEQDNHPYLGLGVRWILGAALPVGNRFTIDLTNVRAATIDARAAGLVGHGLTVAGRSDGPATIVLAGIHGGGADASGATVSNTASGLVITIPGAGEFTITTAG